MADTATTRCGVVCRMVLIRSAMARIFSAVATELPPYFWTTIEPNAMRVLFPLLPFYFLLCTCNGRFPRLLHEVVEFLERTAQLQRRAHARRHHLGRLVAVARDAD